MGTKHDELTEEELTSYNVNPTVLGQLNSFLKRFPEMKPEDINILDWGCGRGRSVAKLREKGFNAFGVDIDLTTMSNGFTLFEQRGLPPKSILKPVTELADFKDGYFHLIFSEQVLEHVANLDEMLNEQARLTISGGIGVHCFPGAKNIWESHLHMPLVHWLPKVSIRKYWISIMLLLSCGPKSPWPETKDESFWKATDVYYRYMNEHTYYRKTETICKQFEKNNFEMKCVINTAFSPLLQFLPRNIHRNGFPRGTVLLIVKRRTNDQDQPVCST